MVPESVFLGTILMLVTVVSSTDDVCPAGSSCNGEHYWSSRGRNPLTASSTPHAAPTDLSSGPTWVWKNENDEQTRHSPLIDTEKSIYITGARRVRKFSPNGDLLWLYTMDAGTRTSVSPALYKDRLYLMSRSDTSATQFLTTLNLQTGEKTWANTYTNLYSNPDATSILVYNDTVLMPSRDHIESRPYPGGEDGNNQMTAVSAKNGEILWNYVFDDVIWNFIPTTTGENDILVGSQCGGVWRVNFDGKLLWRGGRRNPGHWCGCGGGVAGPNGIFYSVFNDHEEQTRGKGVVQAIRISDGSLLWEKYFGRFEGWQYPAVGKVGPDGKLAVVAALGGITSPPPFPHDLPFPAIVKTWFWNLYVYYSWYRDFLKIPYLPNAIVVLDPMTGDERWRFVEEEWNHIAAKSDEEDLERRATSHIDSEVICLPDPQGIPLIAGDGTVYGSSSHNGDLTAIKDANNNGIIEPTEVSTFKTGKEFLNSPSLAPGMLVAAPCWGPVYVFKTKK